MHVIIVGAGPSGLALALILAKGGIKVTILDAGASVDERPRAAHYAPNAIRVLKAAGVLEDVREQGFVPGDITFRFFDGSVIASLVDSSQHSNPEAMTVLPLGLLGKVLIEHTERLKDKIEIRWSHAVVDVGSDEHEAWAKVKLADGSETILKAEYLCGCDGANSQVRKSLFGEKFDGITWDAQIVATNVYYPFEKFGYGDINFIIHPEHYYMAARITRDGMWRVSYGEDTNLNLDQIKENQPKKYEHMLPGNPKPGDYKLTNCSPYRIHQRCAERMRVGRICLAADAAHLCNPFGGMGLTGGLVDVHGLSECLMGIANGQADEKILDKYDEVRRHVYKTLIDPISSGNFLRVSSKDPEKTGQEDETLNLFRKANKDPEVKAQVDQSVYAICHDFTQYYNHLNGH